MSALRTVFAGTPDFAVPALRALIDSGHRPLAVLCQPDRPAGRGRKLRVGPVKACALEAGIEVMQPPSLKPDEAVESLAALAPDLLITAAYGLLLPRRVLDLPRLGCWNLHASLLPRWRGASPINQAILAGDATTGMTLMQMDPGLDTGPILMRTATDIRPGESAGELHDRLARIAAELLTDALDRVARGDLPEARAQNDAEATHAPLIRREDAHLDWTRPAVELARQVRAYNPWPVAFGEVEGLQVRVFEAEAIDRPDAEPGRLIRGHGHPDAIVVGCGEGALLISSLQAPGRKRVSARDWLNAHPDWA
ncbi:methionyl-tRNA formyltransferase [Leptolyngbya valderiana BDU 20041]|nr:methionyl-tRNA formyltransferase [Leptolyngbya valderiana BDU 20041]